MKLNEVKTLTEAIPSGRMRDQTKAYKRGIVVKAERDRKDAEAARTKEYYRAIPRAKQKLRNMDAKYLMMAFSEIVDSNYDHPDDWIPDLLNILQKIMDRNPKAKEWLVDKIVKSAADQGSSLYIDDNKISINFHNQGDWQAVDRSRRKFF